MGQGAHLPLAYSLKTADGGVFNVIKNKVGVWVPLSLNAAWIMA